MKSYRWPGNIRELENLIERAFVIENQAQIRVESLPDAVKKAMGTSPNSPVRGTASATVSSTVPTGLDFEKFKEDAEKEFIISALKANKGRINQTVAQANIPKNTLLRKIKKYGIDVKTLSGSS